VGNSVGGPVNGSSSSGHAGGGSGGGAEDDGAADSADEFPPGAVSPSPPTTTTPRSVSATLQYEREQRPRGVNSRASPRPSNASDGGSRPHHRNSHPPPPPPQTHQQQQQQHNARDTFLNYFFGQNGPGPIVAVSAGGHVGAGASAAGSADGMMPSGRDVSGATQRSGLSLAGKLDGNSAAYDMKSLGKHIEAVSVFRFARASGC
jgi:dynamin 1-like protein